MISLKEELSGNVYPGRGIFLGKSKDGKKAVIAYFIMGRSENSRNRIFKADLNDGIHTEAFDETKIIDPSLVIYSAVRVMSNCTIITNGDQTDTVFEYLDEGGTFEEALRTRTFEPDPPILTPRISGLLVELGEGEFSYKLSILKSDNGNSECALRQFFDYAKPLAGQGHLIHTYQNDGNPPLSFKGEPTTVSISENTIDSFTKKMWGALNADNRVSLFTRFIDLNSGDIDSRIVNRHEN